MATTQENRILSISPILGEDFLLLDQVSFAEEISELFECKVKLLHEENEEGFEPTDVDIQAILGKGVTISISQPDGTSRTLSGIFNSFSKGGRDNRFSYYYATIVPHVWLLTQNFQSRIFQHKTVEEILTEVLDGFEVSFEIQGDFKPRNYCVQYRETDFDFISRLMEEEGFYYYFEHLDGKHKMIIANTPQSHQDVPSKSEIPYFTEVANEPLFVSSIRDFWIDYKLQSGTRTYRDYNFELPTNSLEVNQPSRHNIGGNQELEIYDFPAGYARKYDGIDRTGGENSNALQSMFPDKTRTAENAMHAIDSQYMVLSGNSDCCSMTVGHRFSLINHPNKKLNAQYVLTKITHTVEQSPAYISDEIVENAYSANFTCIPHGAGATPFVPEKRTPKPIMQGSQTATVVGPSGEEIFTDKYGRVKVQFHWHREGKFDADSSCWVRVAKDSAGSKYGSMYIPRIGQEVIVDFLAGDPDQPIITGSVYNPETMPHYELPKYKTLSYIKTRTSPDDGKGFNELRFEDKKGKEQVFIHSQKRMDTRVRGSFYETCGGNRQERIGVRSDNKPGGNLAVTVGGNHDLHVKEAQYIGIDKKRNETVKEDVIENYQGKQYTEVTNEIELNAKKITLEASQKVTLKVGSSFIVVDMMGITIKGPMVKINSGGAAQGTSPAVIDDPLDASSADTGKPGYLDRPRTGGGRRGRTSRTLNGQHAPSVRRNDDGTYNVGGDNLIVDGTDHHVSETLEDLSTLYNTPTGRDIIDTINNGTHQTTIRTLDVATAQRNGALATRVDQTGSVTPGQGSDTIVQYNPDVPDAGYTDEDGNSVTLPNEAMLGHELIHAVHNDTGDNLRNNPEPAEPDSNEEESQTIGIHGHADDEMTHNQLLEEMDSPYRRTDHDTSVVTAPEEE